MRFSERVGAVAPRSIQVEEVDSALRNRIWNYYCSLDEYWCDRSYDTAKHRASEITDRLGFLSTGYSPNLSNLKSAVLNREWFMVYDFVEVLVSVLAESEQREAVEDLNDLFEEEKSGYRIVKAGCSDASSFQVVPIVDQLEIASLEEASSAPYESVNSHLAKALAFYSDRQHPDYPNSIKESISAVESLCCHITGDRKATLGTALKKLESEGWGIHGSLKLALEKLYGYASDEDGIRHGGIDPSKAEAEDALFMLVSCSAFVNYLIEKKRKLDAANSQGVLR
ncbi:MAG: hypothetical protein HFJ66_02990 [Eggerthellaceae bacterium]|nr:hypothetical protein [Eggerthellaceae bacterium]